MKSIHIGDKVQWTCKPYNGKPFVCNGIIRKIEASTFGGKKQGKGASIEVRTQKYWSLMKKKITFVGVDKLTLLD
ncbi:MAG: hypothetical protein HY959_03800 [Ignavibacteriae bacterium]|nr:hypothetical protein [Ignavibacteriota bacterium]